MRVRRLATLAVLALAGLAPAVAQAGAVGNRITFAGIGGLNVDSTFAHVEHVLGRPQSTTHYHGRLDSLFFFKRGLVFSITTGHGVSDYALDATSPHYRLADGLHIGVSERVARRDLRGAECVGNGCSLYDPHDRNRDINVAFRRGRVFGIAVYLTVDH